MSIALINGKIYTLNEKNTIEEALAIVKNRIKSVGSTDEILNLKTDFDQVIDLKGNIVLPGFIDAHTHLGHSGLESLWVDLSNTTSTDGILKLVKERTEKTPEGEWVVGVMYDDSGWRYQECLTKDSLDTISTKHPIFLRRVCGHYGVVNSRALEQISDDWQYVDRDTGVLLEDAVLGFMKIIKPDLSLRIDGTRKVLPQAYSHGLTAVREIVNLQSIQSFHFLDNKNELKLRIFGYIIFDDLNEYLGQFLNGLPECNNFNIIGVKLFIDGSLGARTAALKEPYSDEPGNAGKLLNSDSELQMAFDWIKVLDMSMMVHAIGDGALQQFLSVYPKVFNDQIPKNPKRHSIEHVEVIDDGLLNEIKNLGIIVSAQPNFAGRWSGPGGLNEKRLGKDRLLRCNAYKEFLDSKIPLIFGSDSMPLDPLFGIKSAIFHPIHEQRISPIDAIKAYVQNYYKIFNLESNFGSIEPGKVADLVILTADPFIIGEGTFDKIQVVGTIINGEIVFSKL